jgi:hypothetical protein
MRCAALTVRLAQLAPQTQTRPEFAQQALNQATHALTSFSASSIV